MGKSAAKTHAGAFAQHFDKKNFLESVAVAIPKLIGRATKNARQQRELDTGVFTKLSSKINSTNCNRSLYGVFY